MSYSARPALLLGSIIHQKCDFGAYGRKPDRWARIAGRAQTNPPGDPNRPFPPRRNAARPEITHQ